VVLSPHVPDLSALEALLAVAHTGSMNAAAHEIGTSQQALSARIASLEARTGLPLVVRTTRGSTLTAPGRLLAQWATRVLEAAAELDAGLAALREDRRDRLRVSASLTIAEQLLPAWLVALRARALHAGTAPVEVFFTAGNSDAVLHQVRAGEADVGFIEGPTAPKDLRSRIIGHDELVTVVRPDHPWARRRSPVTARELAATALVSREEGSGTREALLAALADALGPDTHPVQPTLQLSTTAAVRAAVLAAAGPAVLSELAVRDDLATGRLRRVPVAGLDLRRSLRAVWQDTRQPPQGAVRDLIAHASSGLARVPGSATAANPGMPPHDAYEPVGNSAVTARAQPPPGPRP
jgi:DNA-binding transcriptional LysR family regulator